MLLNNCIVEDVDPLQHGSTSVINAVAGMFRLEPLALSKVLNVTIQPSLLLCLLQQQNIL